MIKLILVATLLLLFPIVLLAEEAAYTLNCSFPTAVNKEGKKSQEFGFQILMDMSEDGMKAYVIGSMATVPLVVIPGNGFFTFIEKTSTGNVMTTTFIFGTGEAVHSRHSVMKGNLALATQNYGQCM
jgi:hypothetical protein